MKMYKLSTIFISTATLSNLCGVGADAGMASGQRRPRDIETRFNKAVSVVQSLPKDGTNIPTVEAECVRFNTNLINSGITIV